MRSKSTLFVLILLLAWTGCCSTGRIEYELPPEPGRPASVTPDLSGAAAEAIDSIADLGAYVRGLSRDGIALMIYGARWKVWGADTMLIIGKISKEERDAIVAPLLDGIAAAEAALEDIAAGG